MSDTQHGTDQWSRLKTRERRGSRARCILLTDGTRDVVAQRITELIAPFGAVAAGDVWMPHGFSDPREARLEEAPGLLTESQRVMLAEWWLSIKHPHANTPNWDIAATALIGDHRGLVLTEAKAHANELSDSGKSISPETNLENHSRIQSCCREANEALNRVCAGWSLSSDSHYQLCNRFAFGWKLASMGIPVVLMYLGFLNATEMCDEGAPFRSDREWRQLVLTHSRQIVPETIWEQPVSVGGTSFRPIIRSTELSL